MSYIIKILVLAVMVSALKAQETTTVQSNNETTTSAPYQAGVQLMTVNSEQDGEYYHVVCLDGTQRTAHVMCHTNDEMHWPTDHDAQVTMRCPGSGNGATIVYMQVDLWTTTKKVQCRILEGGIGYRYVKLTMEAKGTKYLKYVADFYNP